MHTTPVPTRHLFFLVGLLLVMLLGYGVLVLYPAYASGLAATPDPTAAELVVPLYTSGASSYTPGATPAPLFALAFSFLALFWCVVPLCSLTLLAAIVVPGRVVSRARRRRVALALLGCWSVVLLTAPAANTFVIWLMD
jgi:hypothetical protein